MWMRATRKSGFRLPWAYVRRHIARSWGVPPWVVDQAPAREVATELRILALEAEYRPPQAPKR